MDDAIDALADHLDDEALGGTELGPGLEPGFLIHVAHALRVAKEAGLFDGLAEKIDVTVARRPAPTQ